MRHNNILIALQKLILRTPKQREIAEAIGTSLSNIGNRAVRNTKYTLDEILQLSEYFQVDILGNSIIGGDKITQKAEKPQVEIINNSDEKKSDIVTLENIKEETQLKSVVLHYWNGCATCKEKIINPFFSELIVDMQKIINIYGANPNDLSIIAMTGDEMDGGISPIKNNDLLVINESINDLSSTGIYFCTSDNGVFVRRIAQLVGTNSIYVSVDNPLYSEALNNTISNDVLEEMNFKVIGKVIANESSIL